MASYPILIKKKNDMIQKKHGNFLVSIQEFSTDTYLSILKKLHTPKSSKATINENFFSFLSAHAWMHVYQPFEVSRVEHII